MKFDYFEQWLLLQQNREQAQVLLCGGILSECLIHVVSHLPSVWVPFVFKLPAFLQLACYTGWLAIFLGKELGLALPYQTI